MTTVADIVRAELIRLGADGLCSPGCGCDIEDLFPCGVCGIRLDCEPSVWIMPAPGDSEYDEDWPDGYFKPMEESQ